MTKRMSDERFAQIGNTPPAKWKSPYPLIPELWHELRATRADLAAERARADFAEAQIQDILADRSEPAEWVRREEREAILNQLEHSAFIVREESPELRRGIGLAINTITPSYLGPPPPPPALLARLRECLEALRPFARLADFIDTAQPPPADDVVYHDGTTVGDYRRARAILAPKESDHA